MLSTHTFELSLEPYRPLAEKLAAVFGTDADAIEDVDARALTLLGTYDTVVWEGDAQTFQFTYVSPRVVALLRHPLHRWLEPGFWSDHVLHPDDRNAAVAYCAMATGLCRDHDFEYRAVTPDGDVRRVYDVVHVILGPKGIPTRLRGIMLDVTDQKLAAGVFHSPVRVTAHPAHP